MTNTLDLPSLQTQNLQVSTLKRSNFPAQFTFGVATSSYQIEGAIHEDGRGASIWDAFCDTKGKILDASSGAVACDHYHLWESDLDLIQSLGVDAYRFSVAWPRVIPTGQGAINSAGLDFYDRLIDGLLQREIEPHVTLYHWDLPQPLQELGGWANRETAYRFAEYTAAVVERLGNRVVSYATLNEPWCSSILSYEIGHHAPGLQERKLGLAAAHHLLLGHGLAVPLIRQYAPKSQVGIVLNMGPQVAATNKEEDIASARLADGRLNRWFMDPLYKGHYPQDVWDACLDDVPSVLAGDFEAIQQPLDFLGINYYTRGIITAKGNTLPEEAPVTDMGWEIYPQGLTELLLRLNQDYTLPPIMITENGAAFKDQPVEGMVNDIERVNYFENHLLALHKAIEGGVNVRGYFAWSLMDNFEWAFGYEKRFGLIYVNYETQERLFKQSAHWYKAFLK